MADLNKIKNKLGQHYIGFPSIVSEFPRAINYDKYPSNGEYNEEEILKHWMETLENCLRKNIYSINDVRYKIYYCYICENHTIDYYSIINTWDDITVICHRCYNKYNEILRPKEDWKENNITDILGNMFNYVPISKDENGDIILMDLNLKSKKLGKKCKCVYNSDFDSKYYGYVSYYTIN